MTDDARAEVVGAELSLSEQAFRAAKALRELDLVLDALSRLYFGAFHLATALLASEAIEVRTHKGLHSLFGLHFVKTGRLQTEHQQTIARLETWRDKADYDRGFVADAPLFDREYEAALRFRERVLELLLESGFTAGR